MTTTQQSGKPATSAFTAFVRRHPFALFAALACLFGWGIFIAAGLGFGSDPDNMPLGPIMAAAIVSALLGRTAFRGWARRLRRWGASPRWYAVAVLVPTAITVGLVLVNHLFGAPLPTADQLSAWPDVLATFVVMLVMVGIGEEAGWSAFAAPLLGKHAFVVRWAMLASVRILWHLPLMLAGLLPWTIGIVGNAAWQLIVLCMLDSTDGRWPLAAVWHATLNATSGGFAFTMVEGADKARLGVLLSVAYVLVAVAMVAVTRPTAGSRPLGSGDGRPHARPGHGAGQGGSAPVLVQR